MDVDVDMGADVGLDVDADVDKEVVVDCARGGFSWTLVWRRSCSVSVSVALVWVDGVVRGGRVSGESVMIRDGFSGAREGEMTRGA